MGCCRLSTVDTIVFVHTLIPGRMKSTIKRIAYWVQINITMTETCDKDPFLIEKNGRIGKFISFL